METVDQLRNKWWLGGIFEGDWVVLCQLGKQRLVGGGGGRQLYRAELSYREIT